MAKKSQFEQQAMNFGGLLNDQDVEHVYDESKIRPIRTKKEMPKQKVNNQKQIDKQQALADLFDAFKNKKSDDNVRLVVYVSPIIDQMVRNHCVANRITITSYLNRLIFQNLADI